MATPTKPTSRPSTRGAVNGSSGSTAAAITMTTSGIAPLITAASDEATLCSAQLISENGSATLSTAITTRCPYVRALRGRRSRATATTVASRRKPMARRSVTSVNGGSPASTPIRMNR